MRSFASDNNSGISPEVMEAISKANMLSVTEKTNGQ